MVKAGKKQKRSQPESKVFGNKAYVDGANLHKGIEKLGWALDYHKFRIWLREKYQVDKAYLFIGLVAKHKDLYANLQEAGFTLIFKETTFDGEGKVKGNCDADLVLSVVRDTYEDMFDRAVIVSGDGDYASLVKFLNEKSKLKVVLAPDHKKCSILLKRTGVKITYLDQFKSRLVWKRKSPR